VNLIQELKTKHLPLRIKMSKKPDSIDKLLNIDHSNRVITQKRELNPPTFNGRFRDKVREKYPDYELK